MQSPVTPEFSIYYAAYLNSRNPEGRVVATWWQNSNADQVTLYVADVNQWVYYVPVRNRSLAPSTINCQWLVNAFINCSQTILRVQPKEPCSSWTKAKWKLCQFISGLHYNFIISKANSSWWIHIRYNLLGCHSLRIFKCPLVLLSKIIARIVFELSELIAVSIRKVINSIE